MPKPKLLIFAGSREDSGSGFERLVEDSRTGVLDAEIVGVVSTNSSGGVYERAQRLDIPFFYFGSPWSGVGYILLVIKSGAEFVILCGWPKLVVGLDPCVTINVHYGPLHGFGGPGMYGLSVDRKVLRAYHSNEIAHSAVSMHFVTKKYDEGPLFFSCRVPIYADDTPETLAKRVKECTLRCLSPITNLVVHRHITWDGKNPRSLKVLLSEEV